MSDSENSGLIITPISEFKKHPSKRHGPQYFTLADRIYNSVKQTKRMSGAKNPYSPPFKYKKAPSKQLRPNVKYNANDNNHTQLAKGYHWQKGVTNYSHQVTDYEDTDVFSHFDGNFFLRKVGNKYHAWIKPISVEPIGDNGQPGKNIVDPSAPNVVDVTWTDEDGSKGFALTSIVAQFEKKNIYEDNTYYPHVYHDIDMGVGAVKYWNILNGGNDNSKPHIIAHAGETVVIDTGRMKVYKSDGTDLTKYTSFGSTFPALQGGIINKINFYPTVGTDCDLNMTYIPRIK